LVKYITKYVKDHYDVIKLRRDVADRLREFAKNMNLPISDAVSYLLTNINVNIVNNIVDIVSSEVSRYVLDNYSGSNSKLIHYSGGDYFIFDDLNRIFMTAYKTKTFVEVFGGSCWCSLNVSRSRFKVVVCNDIDQDLINLYKYVKEKPDELVKRLSILPFSREMLQIAKEILNDRSSDPVTKSVMLFYASRASFFGAIGRKDVSFAVSRKANAANKLASAISAIIEYAKKLRDVVLECKDFRDIIKLYDSEKTLFYLDPPYVGKGRETYYRYRFTQADLTTMATLLKSIKGFWVLKISEDNYKLIKDTLPPHEVTEIKTSKNMIKVIDEERPEYIHIIAHNIHNINKTLY